jgi:hypothetical protein
MPKIKKLPGSCRCVECAAVIDYGHSGKPGRPPKRCAACRPAHLEKRMQAMLKRQYAARTAQRAAIAAANLKKGRPSKRGGPRIAP